MHQLSFKHYDSYYNTEMRKLIPRTLQLNIRNQVFALGELH